MGRSVPLLCRRLRRPGLFVTGTDTGVGKTVVACAIALHLRSRGLRVGVCKPFASGCRRDREGLVSEDAEALAHFADCRQPLDVINPIRYGPALAPAVAAEQTRRAPDWAALGRSLHVLEEASDVLLVEGVGGLLVPLDPTDPPSTVRDLIRSLGLPVLVVARATLGTLNHTAMTIALLREANCRIAGVVLNEFEPDTTTNGPNDPSMASNRLWIPRMNDVPVLATVPRCPAHSIAPHEGRIPPGVVDAVGMTFWEDVLGREA